MIRARESAFLLTLLALTFIGPTETPNQSAPPANRCSAQAAAQAADELAKQFDQHQF